MASALTNTGLGTWAFVYVCLIFVGTGSRASEGVLGSAQYLLVVGGPRNGQYWLSPFFAVDSLHIRKRNPADSLMAFALCYFESRLMSW